MYIHECFRANDCIGTQFESQQRNWTFWKGRIQIVHTVVHALTMTCELGSLLPSVKNQMITHMCKASHSSTENRTPEFHYPLCLIMKRKTTIKATVGHLSNKGPLQRTGNLSIGVHRLMTEIYDSVIMSTCSLLYYMLANFTSFH